MKVLDVGAPALAAARLHISPVNQLVTLTRLVASGSLLLVPCLFLWDEPLVTTSGIHHGVYYPLILRDERRLATGDPMARALGSTRAGILAALDQPSTTSRLATSLDLPLSTVSTHLGVLREAGLVTRTRTGRSVTYARRPLSA